MRYTDIAIIGGGLAGSTAAAMLGRAGIPTVLIDPHQVYPFDFRVEKISGDEQLDRFYQTGIADSVLRSATYDGENWIARFGYLLDKKPSRQFGIMYDALISAIRAEILPAAELVYAKVTDVSTSAERQKLTLSNGETISARLVVLANGLNVGLRRNLGIERQIISACHSISIGFDLVPVGRAAFDFPALTYFSERPSDRIPYLTLFPVGKPDARQPVRLSRVRRSLAARDAPAAGRDHECRAAAGCAASPANTALPATSRSGRPISMSAPAIASPASFWSATPLRPPARSPAPAPTRCSPTSRSSATSISRPGLRPKAWTRPRSRPSTTIRSSRPATPGRSAKAFSFRKVTIENGLYWHAQRWARFLAWFGEGTLRRMRERNQRGVEAAALTPRRRHPHHRHRLHCRRRPDRRRCAAYGPGRPRACDRRRWPRAIAHASRARSPCRLRSR